MFRYCYRVLYVGRAFVARLLLVIHKYVPDLKLVSFMPWLQLFVQEPS